MDEQGPERPRRPPALKKINFGLWYSRGLGYIKSGEYEKALRALEFALVIDPENSDAWYYKAFALGCLDRLTESLACYDKAILCAPENIDLLCYKGFVLCDLGRYDEATKLFAKCLDSDPNHVLALVNIAERHLVAGKIDLGLREARKALRLAVDTEFLLLSRWLIIAGFFLKGEKKKAEKERLAMMKHLGSLSHPPKITDWSFECMADLIREKLDQASQRVLFSLIALLTGEDKGKRKNLIKLKS
jgi:tetratricopeptide (TPR) repeat protein